MIYRLLNFLLFASLVPTVSLAQSAAASTDELIPRYDVEIVVFKNLKVPRGQEFILPVSSPGKTDKMLDISSAASVAAASEAGYELLGTDQQRLLEVVTRLVESSRYQLLLHAAWRQPGLELEQAMPVWIKGGRIYGNEYTSIDNKIELFGNRLSADQAGAVEGKSYSFDEQTLEAQELQLLEQKNTVQHNGLYELEGKITISLARYLHTYADLVFRRPRLSSDAELNNAATDAYLQANAADTLILNNHLLREHRRMRSKNLHYLDSPEFAMLILITPYEVAEDFVEAPIEEDPGEPAVAE